jgi:hypothetical protein
MTLSIVSDLCRRPQRSLAEAPAPVVPPIVIERRGIGCPRRANGGDISTLHLGESEIGFYLRLPGADLEHHECTMINRSRPPVAAAHHSKKNLNGCG